MTTNNYRLGQIRQQANWTVQRTRAFTIVELLVVIAIIGILTAILLPAINSAREAARRTQCKNRLRQFAVAANNYEAQNRGYPYFRSHLWVGDAHWKRARRVSWLVQLAPYIGEQQLYNTWRTPLPVADLPRPRLEVLICPSDHTATGDTPALSYMANAGRKELVGPGNEIYIIRGFGVFLEEMSGPNEPNTLDFIQERGDGASRTLMFAENIQLKFKGGQLATRWDVPCSHEGLEWAFIDNHFSNIIVWHATTNPQPAMRVNGDFNQLILSAATARPASYHANGANVAFCDGRVATLRDDIDYRIYIQLMVPQDAAIRKVDPKFADALGVLPPIEEDDYL